MLQSMSERKVGNMIGMLRWGSVEKNVCGFGALFQKRPVRAILSKKGHLQTFNYKNVCPSQK